MYKNMKLLFTIVCFGLYCIQPFAVHNVPDKPYVINTHNRPLTLPAKLKMAYCC